jgi:hypothetical protein
MASGFQYGYNVFERNRKAAKPPDEHRAGLTAPKTALSGQNRGRASDPFPSGEVSMRTQGEIEAAISEGISRFEQEYMGRGPKDIRTHLIGDLLVVRLQGVLTAAEQHLATSLPGVRGRDLLKQGRKRGHH